MRNLTKTLAMVSLLVPASAYPLGIGEIKLHSALNQNLDAEIALVLAPGEKADDIKVNLAPPDKFDESGVPWTYFLAKLKFQTITSGNHVLIKVTSKEALKEPFLDFLLEVTWPKGNLYREFTVLVDPPTVYNQATAPVAAIQEDSHGVQKPAFVRPQARSQAITRRPSKSFQAASGNISSGQYGPTRRNDTLWNVAEKIGRQTGISIEQTMMGLYEANPNAFYKPNVNALLAGKTLKIPERGVFLRLSRQQASAQFNQQNVEWRNRSLEPAVAQATPAAQEGRAESQLTLVAPKQEQASEAGAVSAGKNTAGLTGQQPTDEMSQPGTPSSNQIIEDKIAALEQQLAAMQQVIALKDEQLAALQQQSQAKTALPAQQVPQVQPAPQVKVPKSIATGQPTTPIEQKTVTQPTVKKTQPQPEEDNTAWYLVGAGAGTGLLVYLGWLFWRRRGQREQGSPHEFAFAHALQPSIKASDALLGAGAGFEERAESGNSFESENLFSSDLVVGEFDMFDIDQEEIDPVSEADVYMAYGRYQQAEELIRLALKDQPERDDYKLKLLEIFFASENRQAFDNYAHELFNAGKNNNDVFWEKVAEMGGELCPDSHLFSMAETPKLELNKAAFSIPADSFLPADQSLFEEGVSDKLLDDTDFDLASFEELFGAGSAENLSMDDAGQMLFGSEDNTLAGSASVAPVPADEPEKNNQPIEFDLSGFSIGNEEVIDIKENDVNKSAEAMAFGIIQTDDAIAEAAVLKPAKETAADHEELTFSFDPPLSFKESIAKTKLDDDFDFNVAAGQFDDSSYLDGATDITEMDEMELQLDLAIAYIDMGDKDAAREIATQVYEKGAEEQKMVAKSLLDNL